MVYAVCPASMQCIGFHQEHNPRVHKRLDHHASTTAIRVVPPCLFAVLLPTYLVYMYTRTPSITYLRVRTVVSTEHVRRNNTRRHKYATNKYQVPVSPVRTWYLVYIMCVYESTLAPCLGTGPSSQQQDKICNTTLQLLIYNNNKLVQNL